MPDRPRPGDYVGMPFGSVGTTCPFFFVALRSLPAWYLYRRTIPWSGGGERMRLTRSSGDGRSQQLLWRGVDARPQESSPT